jgi:crotonobetaine/carnitine-CoA ligase
MYGETMAGRLLGCLAWRIMSYLNDPQGWVLPATLEEQATRRPHQAFVTSLGEGTITYEEAARQVRQVAATFAGLGVQSGESVAVLLPNGLDYVRVWLGLGRLGAVATLINTALTGDFLAYQLRDCGARLVVAAGEAREAFLAVADQLPEMKLVELDGWSDAPEYEGPMPQGRDIAAVMYTSGTTGPSKGVLMPHTHCHLFGRGSIAALGITDADRYYITMPLFHANGLFMQLAATLIAGASAVLRGRFSATAWLSDVREHGCTVTNMLGSMTQFVMNQPPTARDRDHSLRVICPVPNPPAHEAGWRERFGIDEVVSAYGMTEVNIPLYGRLGTSRPGAAGLVLDEWWEVEVRDPETDEVVAPGVVGEIMVRPKVPFGFMAGYLGQPEKTVEAWRNFWFHTGDAGVMAEDGWVSFVDRTKDCIRRRGENISSFEVESAIERLDGVASVAAYAIPADDEGTEDEVMLAVVVADGSGVDVPAIVEYADSVLPRFALPRYVEIVSELPMTPTQKIRKNDLRLRGVTETTWDRAAGGS